MDEVEVPLEKLQEDIEHAVHHADAANQAFLSRAALLSAILAVLAAISALMSGHYANDAMIEQIQSSDRWAYYQAKGIKLAIAELKETQGAAAAAEKIEHYRKDQETIKAEAEHKEAESRAYLRLHESLAASVTLFQIAIALTAIAALTRRKRFLYGASALGAAGALWLLKSLLF